MRKKPLQGQPGGKPVGIFLVSDRCGQAQSLVGGVIPGKVVPGCLRKHTEQAWEASCVSSVSSIYSSTVSASVSASRFAPRVRALASPDDELYPLNQTNHCLP